MDEFSELTKEIFARYGLAYYESEVLHRGLCNFYVLATFKNPESITRARVEEKFVYAFSLTLGQIISETIVFFQEDIKEKLEIALEKRNYLAHHFWYEENYLMYDEQGLIQLKNELMDYADYFDELDSEIQEYLRNIQIKFGITDDMIRNIYEQLILGEKNEPLISHRRPQKKERIVRVWDVEVDDNLVTHVFESDDGTLWQLCDVGLGWTRFTKPEETWKLDEKIQRYLPAEISPRPDINDSWNYEFFLAHGCTLHIQPGKKSGTYLLQIESR